MHEDLAKSALTPADAKALGWAAMIEAECAASLKLNRNADGYKLVAHGIDGKQSRDRLQFRFADTVVPSGFLKGLKLPKYLSEFDSDTAFDLPPIGGTNWSEVAAQPDLHPVVITEGFKKSASATKHVMPTIGLIGVWNFRKKKAGHRDIIPELRDLMKWKNRTVYICYDSDAVNKADVVAAENKLARALADLGARVFIVRIPGDGAGGKVGIDDFIKTRGADEARLLITSAKPYAVSTELHDMAEHYGVVKSLAAVIEFPNESHDDTRIMPHWKFREVVGATKKIWVNPETGEPDAVSAKNTKKTSAAKLFLEWEGRPEFDHIDYVPGGDTATERGGYNVWEDPSIVPIAGDTSLFDELLKHGLGNAEERKHVLQWFAYPIQHRGERINHAVVAWSHNKGVGKSALGVVMSYQHGDSNTSPIQQADVEREFNGWAANKTLALVEEIHGVTANDTKALVNRLKVAITVDRIGVNRKYIEEYYVANRVNYYMSSNYEDAVSVDEQERRYFIVHWNEEKMSSDFWHRFWLWAKSETGKSALLHKLLNVDLSDFDAKGDAPKTEAFKSMVEAGHDDLQSFVADLAENSIEALNKPLKVGNGRISVPWKMSAFATLDELYMVFSEYYPHTKGKVSKKRFALVLGRRFKQVNDGGQIRQRDKDAPKLRLWIINPKEAAKVKPEQIAGVYAAARPSTH